MPPKLFISVYQDIARDGTNQSIGAPLAPPLAEQYIDITHESTSSLPFPAYTKFISIKAQADCCIAFNEDADPSYHFVEAGERLFYGVAPGSTISVIDSEMGLYEDDAK